MIDIDADIVPGDRAAGFRLGQSYENVRGSILGIHAWDPASGQGLSGAIRAESSWLSVLKSDLGDAAGVGRVLYYANGMVELHFDDRDFLDGISVFEGYRGLLWGRIKVGDELSKVDAECRLEYDEGDEMHYPADDCNMGGVAFLAEECSLGDAPNQLILGISIYPRG